MHKKQSLLTLMLVLFSSILLFSLTFNISAQETTPEPQPPTDIPTSTETATLIPSPVPTLTETATETATASETLTPTITEGFSPTPTELLATLTATPTLSPTVTTSTGTLTITPTFTPSPTLTATALPAMSLLLADTFDSGDTSNWVLGVGWSMVASEAGYALQVSNSTEPVTAQVTDLLDVAVNLRTQFDAGTARLSVRQSEAGAYTATLNPAGQVALYRGTVLIATGLTDASLPATWRTLRLSAIGSEIRVSVDGADVIAISDPTPLPAGAVAFAVTDSAYGLVDDVEIWVTDAGNVIEASILVPSQTFISSISPAFTTMSSGSTIIFSQYFGGSIPPTEVEAIVEQPPLGSNTYISSGALYGSLGIGSNVNVNLEASFLLGDDPDQTYRVTALTFNAPYNITPGTLAASAHQVVVLMRDGDGNIVHTFSTCQYAPVPVPTSICEEQGFGTLSIDNVYKVTIIHRIVGTVSYASGRDYRVGLDNVKIYAEQTQVTPTPTPTTTPELPIVCHATVQTTANAAFIRAEPTTNSTTAGQLLNGTTLDILGKFYNITDSGTDGIWYRIRFEDTLEGWMQNSVVTLDADCENVDIPFLDENGIPLSPPPPMDPTVCNGVPIESEAMLEDPREAFIHIRDYPVDGTEVASFGTWGSIGNHVQVIGRYTANTPETWDDWYKVTYIGADPSADLWVSAEYTTLSPSYLSTLCQVPVYTFNSTNNEWEVGSSFIFLSQPAPVPEALQLYQSAVDLHLPAPFTRTPVSDNADYDWGQGYGLNVFGYQHPDNYEGTNHIHSGLDFGGEDANGSAVGCITEIACIRVVPICDGRVVSLSGTAGTSTGNGLVIRCFAPEGSLSNIYVSYNHLQDTGTLTADLSALSSLARAGIEYELNAYQYNGNPWPHLHLEVFFDRDADISNGIRMNPLLFFSLDAFQTIFSRLGPYYPENDRVRNELRMFELEPADEIDPVQQPIPAVSFFGSYNGIVPSQLGQYEDLDLGIRFGEISTFTILADQRGLASGIEAYCSSYVWARDDQSITFVYQGGNNPQSCGIGGIVGLQIMPTANPYDGFEGLDDRWIQTNETLFNLLQSQDR